MNASEHARDVQDDAEAEHAEGSDNASAASLQVLQVHKEHLQGLAPAAQLPRTSDAAEDVPAPEPSFGKVQPLAADEAEDAHVLELSSSKAPLLHLTTLLRSALWQQYKCTRICPTSQLACRAPACAPWLHSDE